MEQNFRIAVKAFIVKNGKVLLIKRRSNDVHKPGEWDIPGGRLDPGENPLDGVKREAVEEVGLDVDVQLPLDIHHFTRDDGQQVTMIIFLCSTRSENVRLSEEHTEHSWADLQEDLDTFPRWLHSVIKNYTTYIKH